jgi:hypothetical protein
MQRVAIAIVILSLCFASIALASPLLAQDNRIDRVPTQAELDRIEAVRAMIAERGYTWEAGVTSVSNLTDEEMKQLCGLRIPPDLEARRARAKQLGRMVEEIPGMAFPASFDWRTQGGVTPVKNQGGCGSCWAFCGVAAVESQILIRSGVEEDLSEAAVLSCNPAGEGCSGGWMSTVYDLFMSDGALRESCMPYHEVDTDPCLQGSCDVAGMLTGYYPVDDNVNAIKTALLNGPVASGIAVCSGFQTYTGGCFQDTCSDLNHGVLIIGWDDTQCGGQGAWIIKNSWAPSWGTNGFMYIKYGASMIGYGIDALNYTPGQTVHFFYNSHLVNDSGGDNDGFVDVGEPVVLPITILNIGAATATNVSAKLRCLTPGVTVTDSMASYADIPKGTTKQSDAPHFAFTVTGAGPSCGPISFQLIVTSTQGTSPINIKLQAGQIVTVFQDDFETNKGWSTSATGDNATTGIWTRVDPIGTWWGNLPVQPEDDNTAAPGTMCYVTGQGTVGGAQGAMDIDGGKTTLTSPTIDLSGKNSALLSYSRWYASETGSAPNDDDFVVDVSNNNGTTWVNLETLTYSDRAWRKKEFYLEDFITLTSQVKVRFIGQDNAPGSVVEAALDDFMIKACQNAAADAIPPTVAVVLPNGGETLVYGTPYEVRWNASDNIGVTSIDIYLSTDGGATYPVTIATGEANDGSYMWTVNDLDSKTAKVKVEAFDAAHNKGVDVSNANFVLSGSTSGVPAADPAGVPREVVLNVAGGNPVRAGSTIVFGLPAAAQVMVGIYDVKGRLVEMPVDGYKAAGYHTVELGGAGQAASLSTGIYFVRVDCAQGQRTTKIAIVK